MTYKNVFTKAKRYHQKLNGSTIEYDISKYQNKLKEIDSLKNEYSLKTDEQLKCISERLKNEVQINGNPDEILVEAFALVREAVKRILKLEPFDVQIIGGIVIHEGKLAEMKTGEGKTLAAVFPAYLNALTGKGIHVLTFNDYLARRDAEWMGPIFNFLGLKAGFVQEGMSIPDRQNAYNADITYLTAKEAGFDFLRDSIAYSEKDIVQRNHNFAIVDEADSIMIDEARIPLIIAGSSDEKAVKSYTMAKLAKKLKEKTDFEFDKYSRNIHLTDSGLLSVESELDCQNIYDKENIELLTDLNCALHAEYLLHCDVDYIIKNGKVELVDEFTGRVAEKRRWPDGLQEAIEAKENLDIQTKGKILNSVSVQHYLLLYKKLGGMTATASVAESEFRDFYKMDIVVVPQNKSCVRIDNEDVIFKTKEAKNRAVINEIIKENKTGRPVLVGTGSVAESTKLAGDLKANGINCEVLNAHHDALEAKIIAKAGKKGAVTVSTNMAGRGTDIILGAGDENEKKQIIELGGLYVIGTNRYESRRIDDQLRGRAGRQGDAGESRFFISLQDDLFVKYKLMDLFPPRLLTSEKEELLTNPLISKEFNRMQRVIEGQNTEIKKTLNKYSFLTEQQRKIISEHRNKILFSDATLELFRNNLPGKFKELQAIEGKEKLRDICRHISLFYIDQNWCSYLAEIADIRDSIHFRRLGGQEPIFEFHKLSVEIFSGLIDKIDDMVLSELNNIDTGNYNPDYVFSGLKGPSATWTYLVNDETFENILGIGMVGNVALSVWAGLFWPITILIPLVRKWSRNKRDNK